VSISRPVSDMATIIDSIRAEFRRYKALAEAAIAQVSETELTSHEGDYGNSIDKK